MRHLTDVSAAILVGGLGTRLRSVVPDRPKALAEIDGRPFVTYLLDQLAAAGVRHVVLCTGYEGRQVRATLGESYGSLRLSYSHESSPLGTGGALSLALPLLKSDPVLVLNGDSFCDADLDAFCGWHSALAAEAALLVAKVSDTKRYGRVQVDVDGRLVSFEEKGANDRAGWISAGIYLLAQRLLITIPSNTEVSLERDVFPAAIGRRSLYAYQSEGRFLDIGTPESYAAAARFFTPEASA